MTEQKRAAVEYTQEELETMTKAVLNGATIGDVCNVSQDMLESLYSLGYNLYTSGNYKDAETVFSGLCLYDHNDPRFWMGLAGSRQANGKYQEAEGEVLVRDFLADTGLDERQIDRVAYLVGHHHTLTGISGADYQILIEADYLVNADESSYSAENIRNFRDKFFKTKTGIRLLNDIYRV